MELINFRIVFREIEKLDWWSYNTTMDHFSPEQEQRPQRESFVLSRFVVLQSFDQLANPSQFYNPLEQVGYFEQIPPGAFFHCIPAVRKEDVSEKTRFVELGGDFGIDVVNHRETILEGYLQRAEEAQTVERLFEEGHQEPTVAHLLIRLTPENFSRFQNILYKVIRGNIHHDYVRFSSFDEIARGPVALDVRNISKEMLIDLEEGVKVGLYTKSNRNPSYMQYGKMLQERQ